MIGPYTKRRGESASCLSRFLGSRIALPEDKQRQSAHACMKYIAHPQTDKNMPA